MRITGRFFACVILLALSVPLMAQVQTGTIVGTVTDPSGAVIQKATVTVTQEHWGVPCHPNRREWSVFCTITATRHV